MEHGVRHLETFRARCQHALRVDKRADGLAREGVRHLGAWSKTSWSLEEDSFAHLGAWSKTSWSKRTISGDLGADIRCSMKDVR